MSRLDGFPWSPDSKLARRTSPISESDAAHLFEPDKPRRSHIRTRLAVWALPVLFWLLFPPPTYAYIDPGTGSYILQVVIAGLLGALVSLRIYWARIKTFLRGRSPFGRNDPAEHE